MKSRQIWPEKWIRNLFSVFYQLMLVNQKNMKTYCVKCRKNTENLNSKIFLTKNVRLIMQSKCAECGFKKVKICERTRSKRTIK